MRTLAILQVYQKTATAAAHWFLNSKSHAFSWQLICDKPLTTRFQWRIAYFTAQYAIESM